MAASIILADGFDGATTIQTVHNEPFNNTNALVKTSGSGADSLAANVFTQGGGDAHAFGHSDWTDGTITARFIYQTGSNPALVFHNGARGDFRSNAIAFWVTGTTGVQFDKWVAGTRTTALASATIAALVNGTAYWLRISASGTSYTGTIFADTAGAIGAQLGTVTVTITDAALQQGSGMVAEFGGTTAAKWGGAFSSVLTVTAPIPVGWQPTGAGTDVPSYCWSAVSPRTGLRSLSIYSPTTSAYGYYQTPAPIVMPNAPTLGTYYVKGPGENFYIGDPNNDQVNFGAAGATWTARSFSFTPTGNGTVYLRTGVNNANVGTYYWDDLVITQGTLPAQPSLALSSGRSIAKFGNAALPNGQGTLSNIDLNDGTNSFFNDFLNDDANVQRGLSQLIYLAKGAWTSTDFGPRLIVLKLRYADTGGKYLGQFLAQLSQADEQQLTFDNATYILAKFAAARNRQWLATNPIPSWGFDLELLAKTPWFVDLVASSLNAFTLTADTGQNFGLPSFGTVFAEPVFTLKVPSSNAVALNSMQLQNAMSGEFLTVNFLSASAIPASTARTVVIDCAAMTATCTETGEFYDVTGSFPRIYPPQGIVNTFTVIITPASGSSSGLILSCSISPRWQI